MLESHSKAPPQTNAVGYFRGRTNIPSFGSDLVAQLELQIAGLHGYFNCAEWKVLFAFFSFSFCKANGPLEQS